VTVTRSSIPVGRRVSSMVKPSAETSTTRLMVAKAGLETRSS